MKILTTIVRILLGAAFVFFGLNGFLMFMKMPEMPASLAKDFTTAMFVTHFFWVVAGSQVAGGLLLLLGSRFVPLGLLLLGPVVVNILCYHIFMEPKGLPMAVIFSALSLLLFWAYRGAFAGICPGHSKPAVEPPGKT